MLRVGRSAVLQTSPCPPVPFSPPHPRPPPLLSMAPLCPFPAHPPLTSCVRKGTIWAQMALSLLTISAWKGRWESAPWLCPPSQQRRAARGASSPQKGRNPHVSHLNPPHQLQIPHDHAEPGADPQHPSFCHPTGTVLSHPGVRGAMGLRRRAPPGSPPANKRSKGGGAEPAGGGWQLTCHFVRQRSKLISLAESPR